MSERLTLAQQVNHGVLVAQLDGTLPDDVQESCGFSALTQDLRAGGEELDLRGVDDTPEFVIGELVERRIPTEERVDRDHVAEYGTGSEREPLELRRPTMPNYRRSAPTRGRSRRVIAPPRRPRTSSGRCTKGCPPT